MEFDAYGEMVRGRGAMGFEVFAVTSELVATAEEAATALPEHLAYIKQLEAEGALMLAGPVSDLDGRAVAGGMLVLRAENLDAAKRLADGDPMHARGLRRYTIRRWLINEGGATVRFTFASGPAALI